MQTPWNRQELLFEPEWRHWLVSVNFTLTLLLKLNATLCDCYLKGTEGWIAAELISHLYDSSFELENYENSQEMWDNIDKMESNIKKKVTKAVDIFSMGCVYYYVLSCGSHP